MNTEPINEGEIKYFETTTHELMAEPSDALVNMWRDLFAACMTRDLPDEEKELYLALTKRLHAQISILGIISTIGK